MLPPSPPVEATPDKEQQRRDEVLSMVRTLHAEGNTAAVEEIVALLLRETKDLKRQLMEKCLRRKKG